MVFLFVPVRKPALPRPGSGLNLRHQIAQANPQRLGDPHERMHAHRLFAPLDFADIDRVQLRLFREFFLRQRGALAVFPNCFTDDFAMLVGFRHRCVGNQGWGGTDTVLNPLFFRLLSLGR